MAFPLPDPALDHRKEKRSTNEAGVRSSTPAGHGPDSEAEAPFMAAWMTLKSYPEPPGAARPGRAIKHSQVIKRVGISLD